MTEGWRQLYNEQFHNLYSSSNITNYKVVNYIIVSILLLFHQILCGGEIGYRLFGVRATSVLSHLS